MGCLTRPATRYVLKVKVCLDRGPAGYKHDVSYKFVKNFNRSHNPRSESEPARACIVMCVIATVHGM